MSVSILFNQEAKNNEDLNIHCNSIDCKIFNTQNIIIDHLNVQQIEAKDVITSTMEAGDVQTVNLTADLITCNDMAVTNISVGNSIDVVNINTGSITTVNSTTNTLFVDTLSQKLALSICNPVASFPFTLPTQNVYFPITGTPTIRHGDNNLFQYQNNNLNSSQYSVILDGLYEVEAYFCGVSNAASHNFGCSVVINNAQPVINGESIDFLYLLPANSLFSFTINDVRVINAGSVINIVLTCRTAGNVTINISRWYLKISKIG